MSSTKIKRLKTPVKSRSPLKSPDSTFLSQQNLNQQSTISLIKSSSWSESLQGTLIAEINKLYLQIASVKQENKRTKQVAESLALNKRELQSVLAALNQEVRQLKDKYYLQQSNHKQLRKFYQQRQLEWVFIVNEHRKLLQSYDQMHGTSLSKIEQPCTASQSSLLIHKSYEQLPMRQPTEFKSQNLIQPSFQKRQMRLLKKSSLQRNNNSAPKFKVQKEKRKDENNYYKQLSRLYNQQAKFTISSKEQYKTILKQSVKSVKSKNSHKNPQNDEFFDRIVRKTYYKYKQKCVSVNEIEGMQDMVKLKNANTSTRQRLAKTIRKLNFQIQNDQQLKIICEYVQKAVIDKYKTLRGDFAFEFLIDKLKQCEKLALSSNSQLQRLDKEKSNFKDSLIELESKNIHRNQLFIGNICSDLALQSKNNSVVQKISQKNLQLLLNSTIKQVTKLDSKILDNSSSKSRCSLSSENNLSQLIRSDPQSKTNEGRYFKFGGMNKESKI